LYEFCEAREDALVLIHNSTDSFEIIFWSIHRILI
jgi:hypothetical protein